MKILRTMLTATALLSLQPALPTLAEAQASSFTSFDSQKQVEAAYALAYRGLKLTEAASSVRENPNHPNLRKASRLGQQIRSRAFELADRLKQEGADVGRLLDDCEKLVYQLDATRRELQSSHRQERELQRALGDVRRTYFYLKQLLSEPE